MLYFGKKIIFMISQYQKTVQAVQTSAHEREEGESFTLKEIVNLVEEKVSFLPLERTIEGVLRNMNCVEKTRDEEGEEDEPYILTFSPLGLFEELDESSKLTLQDFEQKLPLKPGKCQDCQGRLLPEVEQRRSGLKRVPCKVLIDLYQGKRWQIFREIMDRERKIPVR